MSRKDKKIILIAQCLVNPYCRVHVLGQNFPLSHELVNYLMENKVGIVQYPCPETTAMGLMRNPQGRQQYDNIFFRSHCKELLKIPLLMVKEFLKNNYSLTCFIGLENSPTCGIHWGKHKVNKYQTESINPVDKPDPDEPILKGIMVDILEEEFEKENIHVPFLEFPVQSQPDSEKRKKFWEELKKAVEPFKIFDYDNVEGEKEHLCPTCLQKTGEFGHMCIPVTQNDKKCDWCGALILESRHLCNSKVQNLKYICNTCGRTAVQAEHLCNPQKIQ